MTNRSNVQSGSIAAVIAQARLATATVGVCASCIDAIIQTGGAAACGDVVGYDTTIAC